MDETLEQRIQRSLDTIRPYLHADGGDVQFRRFSEGVVELVWTGTCRTCPMSMLTLRAGVERALMHDVPEIHRVEAVSN